MVSASGFTSGAKMRAKEAGIDLFRLIDTGKHDWQAFVSIPVLCDFRRPVFSFRYASVPNKKFRLPSTNSKILSSLMVYTYEEESIDTVFSLFCNAWNEGKIPDQLGEHKDIDFIGMETKIIVDGEFYEVRITTNYEVKNKLFFGELSIKEISGFSDEIKGGIITKEFTTDYIDPVKVEKEWQMVENVEELAIKPIAILVAVDFLDANVLDKL